jgi:hypothetical protein
MDQEFTRVRDRIAPAIIDFYEHTGGQFHMDDLRRHVVRAVGVIAPASPDRILRALRRDGRLNYVVLSRRDSLYEWRAVPPPKPEPPATPPRPRPKKQPLLF